MVTWSESILVAGGVMAELFASLLVHRLAPLVCLGDVLLPLLAS